KQPVVQTNYYFETKEFALKNNQSALRIREKNGRYTLTLKEPHPDGILETHDSMTQADVELWLQGRPVPQTNVTKQLKNLGVSEHSLRAYGALKTERFFYRKNEIDYMLDKSFYHGIIDYELEIEAKSKEAGLEALHNLLQKHNIVERKAQPKIARFFAA